MKRLINDIVLELSSRVGIIDFSKTEHINELAEVLEEMGMGNIKWQLIHNLTEESKGLTKAAEDEIKSKGLKHKGYGYYAKNDKVTHKKNPDTGELEKASQDEFEKQNDKEQKNAGNLKKDTPKDDIPKDKNKPADDKSKSSQDKETSTKTTNEPEVEEKPEPRPNLVGKPEEFAHAPDISIDEPTDTTKPITKEERLIKKDNKSVDKYLTLTKRQANNILKKKNKEDVGAGTFESRAGEAMVHKGVRMFKQGKSLDTIKKSLSDIVNTDGHILNTASGKKWVDSSIATLNQINTIIGVENIKDVSWDTAAGKESIGVSNNIDTTSDIFIRTKDNRNIGISLKKDGLVFINNGGWDKQSKIILSSMKDNVSDEAYSRFSDDISVEKYTNDLQNKTVEIYNTKGEEGVRDLIEKTLKLSKKRKDKIFSGKNGTVHLNAIENTNKLINSMKSGNMTVSQTTALSKVLKEFDIKSYDTLRKTEQGLTDRMFDNMKQSKEVRNAMKEYIVDSIHIMDALGVSDNLKAAGLDEFVTIYGVGENGAALDENSLSTLFGTRFVDTLQQVKDGSMRQQDLKDVILDSIEIEEDSGEILFKHENNKKYPLFKIQARTRGIGTAPKMELSQTPLMAHALTQGTFNTDEWDAKSISKFKKVIK